MIEKHYKVREASERLGLSKDVIRALFRHDPATLKLYSPENPHQRVKNRKTKRIGKRQYTVLSIPESALLREIERLRKGQR